MDRKKIIIIAALLLIVAAVAFAMLTSTSYERVEMTPNGTSIEIPTKHLNYLGEFEGIKAWKWNYGALVYYNSQEITDSFGLSGVSLNTINDLVKNSNSENIDGYTCYKINATEILNLLEISYNGDFYCIPLANEPTHDNIIIFSTDKDIALHMAKSVQYK